MLLIVLFAVIGLIAILITAIKTNNLMMVCAVFVVVMVFMFVATIPVSLLEDYVSEKVEACNEYTDTEYQVVSVKLSKDKAHKNKCEVYYLNTDGNLEVDTVNIDDVKVTDGASSFIVREYKLTTVQKLIFVNHTVKTLNVDKDYFG